MTTDESSQEQQNNQDLDASQEMRDQSTTELDAAKAELHTLRANLEAVTSLLSDGLPSADEELKPLLAFTKGFVVNLQDPSDPYKLRGATLLASDALSVLSPCLGGSIVAKSTDLIKSELGSKYTIEPIEETQLVVSLSKLPPWVESLNTTFTAVLDERQKLIDILTSALSILVPVDNVKQPTEESQSDESDSSETDKLLG